MIDARLFEADGFNGWLIVRDGRSLLIDCPAADMGARIRAAGLPLPDAILHTQVQEEHCREWGDLGQTSVHVHDRCEDIARRSERFFAACRTKWSPDRRWEAEDRGIEEYTVGGAMIERPPRQPLNVAGTLAAGAVFRWQGLEFAAVALPGHGKRQIGLHCAKEQTLFCGDLMRAGGFMVNLYDLERGYGQYIGWQEQKASLEAVIALAPVRAYPTSGPMIDNPVADARTLIDRLAKALSPSVRGRGRGDPKPPMRTFGRFRQHAEGLYQGVDGSNMILYIDREGRGLCVDPDICVWFDWATNCGIMHEELDLLEREAGLKRIEAAFITHYHGDHMQHAPLLRERYGTEILATFDVAELLVRSQRYPYPCVLRWYDFPFEYFGVDRRLAYEESFQWHDVPVTPFHLPGHCFAHAGFVIPWNGLKTVCTGDTVQYTRGGIRRSMPVFYNDTAWPDRGHGPGLRRLAGIKPDLVLCGHSHYFSDPDGAIVKDMLDATNEAAELAATLVHDGDLTRAMTVPGFDEIRPECEKLILERKKKLAGMHGMERGAVKHKQAGMNADKRR